MAESFFWRALIFFYSFAVEGAVGDGLRAPCQCHWNFFVQWKLSIFRYVKVRSKVTSTNRHKTGRLKVCKGKTYVVLASFPKPVALPQHWTLLIHGDLKLEGTGRSNPKWREHSPTRRNFAQTIVIIKLQNVENNERDCNFFVSPIFCWSWW